MEDHYARQESQRVWLKERSEAYRTACIETVAGRRDPADEAACVLSGGDEQGAGGVGADTDLGDEFGLSGGHQRH